MSFDPFGRSADLARLAAEGFELELTQAGHLLVRHVPYRTPTGAAGYGIIVTKIEMNGDIAVNPVPDHTIWFVGQLPCDGLNQPLKGVIESRTQDVEPGLTVDHRLSCKRDDGQPYSDNFEKITAYIGLLGPAALAVAPEMTARTGAPCIVRNEDWPFEYVDTASRRAGIGAISGKLADQRIGIVGLGGTGSYILDLVAKCPVQEIHLFDSDTFATHNAFRAPGAAGLEELRSGRPKVDYFASIYSRMKRRNVPHPYNLDASNVGELAGMSFVFLAMEGGEAKRHLVQALESIGLPFVETSVGIAKSKTLDALMASVEVNDPYVENIQVAELNALDATMAVMWWKKWAGIYRVKSLDHHQRFNVNFGRLISE